MDWGTKIAAGLGTFVLLIVGTGIYMVTQNTDTLEEADYYEKSLDYDQVYREKQNLEDDRARPQVSVRGDTLHITFRDAENRGELRFKRPSDGSLDLTLPFATRSTDYQLPAATFKKGNWKLEIRWQGNGRPYISEHNLFF